MNVSTRFNNVATFAASLAVGFGASIAIASVAAATHVAPTLRHGQAAPEIVRLEPVVVTVSKKYFDAVRGDDTALACTTAPRKPTRA